MVTYYIAYAILFFVFSYLIILNFNFNLNKRSLKKINYLISFLIDID